LGYLISKNQSLAPQKCVGLNSEQFSELMLAFLTIQKKVIHEKHVFYRNRPTLKSVYGRFKNLKIKKYFAHLV